MGSTCCVDRRTGQINSFMHQAQHSDSNTVKLLILGPGSTGKSTIVQSLQISHMGGKLSEAERLSTAQLIRINVLDAITILLKQSRVLYERDPQQYASCELVHNPELDAKLAVIQRYEALIMSESVGIPVEMINNDNNHNNDNASLPTNESGHWAGEQLRQLADAIETVWNLPCIQSTLSFRSGNFAISDNMDYFLDKLDTVMQEDYAPTEEDCLKNRTKTCGMNQYEFTSRAMANGATRKKQFQILDVGGQRVERKKWINYCNSVNGLVYVASLVDYTCVLYEDRTVNSMLESVSLFSDMTSLQCFDHSIIILLLNKDDLLRQQLKRVDNGLASCFGPKGVWPRADEYWDPSVDTAFADHLDDPQQFENYHIQVVSFIKQLFVNANKHRALPCMQNNFQNIENIENNTQNIQNNPNNTQNNQNSSNIPNNAQNVQNAHNTSNMQKKVHNNVHVPQNNCSDGGFYSHVTTATDCYVVDKVFSDIQLAFVSDNLNFLGISEPGVTLDATDAQHQEQQQSSKMSKDNESEASKARKIMKRGKASGASENKNDKPVAKLRAWSMSGGSDSGM